MLQKMKKVIHKFRIHQGAVMIPKGAVEMSFQVQDGQVQLWAMVDPSAKPTVRHFDLVPTGSEVPDKAYYHATVQNGECVWHIFEYKK